MKKELKLSDVDFHDEQILAVLASLSYRASKKNSPNWLPTEAAAMNEILNTSASGGLTRMIIEAGIPRGWISASPKRYGNWEIHPLLIDPEVAGRGYGRMLVEDIEQLIRSAGGISVHLSTSDATHSTNLSDVNLYPNPVEALRNLKIRDSQQGHAYQFWMRVGYSVVGVIPDAEGLGVPSIQLAKRL